ncbi:MAG TPA: hypothetical protein VL172_19130 [Kofleriaceae bacterium]|nr:hypothetical protein [Kofleriaceae bacterium]
MARHALLCLLLAAGCGSDPGPGDRRLAVWSEFLTDDEVRAAAPLLAEEQADLYLAMPEARLGDPELAALIEELAADGVGVRAWVLLDEADGYWPNEHNAAAMREAALAFADWRDQAALPVDWIIFDMEMDIARTRAINDAITADGPTAALDLIEAGRDPESFAAGRADYVALLDELHGRGLKVMAVTYPMVLDDPGDGDDDIQDEMDVPVLGLPWDQASFMVYQSLIYDLTGEWHGPDVIANYTSAARELFGDRGAVALGIVGSAGITPVAMSYPDASTLLADHAAARARSAAAVSIYSLDGVLQQDDPGVWLDAEIPAAEPPEVTSEYLRKLVAALLDDD